MDKIKAALRNVIPNTWTHVKNIDPLRLRFNLKLAGVNWESEKHLAKILVGFTQTGIIDVTKENGITYMRVL